MAGIEPATATLAGRARYLSCHPRLASASFASACRFMVLTLWTCQLSSLYRRLFGTRAFRTVNSAGSKRNRPEGISPGAAAGNCLLALTRQPLRRPGQPKAAAPDSCTRAASAPGERSCLHGKPMAETGQLYFRGHSAMRCRGPGDGARIPAGNGLLPLRHHPYRLTMWMLCSCCWNAMRFA